MQENRFLHPRTAAAIDQRVEKLLKDLGNPEPPLSLRPVRKLLELDIGYYSSDDDSWLQEKIHEMKIAGKQVIEKPSLILKVVRSLNLKGVLLAERRQILLDEEVPKPKHRWNEAHEIIHDLLPWHDGIAHGDPETTLSPACHEQVENEANYGAGRLLFLGSQLEEDVRSSAHSFELVRKTKAKYGNTMTTTLWRVVELSLDPAFGLITVHPRDRSGKQGDVRYLIRSPRFAAEYARTDGVSLFGNVASKCHGRRGPIGDGELQIVDDRGDRHEFVFESFFNGYDALTLGWHVGTASSRIITLG